jgi:NAD(P)-dependent dehydrogenase (short-subunit alcohol dehydrogenase family)
VAALALELAPVRVNLVAAGFVDTPLSASVLGDQLEQRRQELHRDPHTERVHPAAVPYHRRAVRPVRAERGPR